MTENRAVPFEFSDYVLRRTFVEAGKRQGWLDDGHIIVAVSGGGDSIALLWMCCSFFDGKVTALHVNHGIRGQESDGDESFTSAFAESLGAQFVRVRVNAPSGRLKGESLESAARRLRLDALCANAGTLGVRNVLLGHNRDDLAETVLFNILRGTGIRGAVGMTECSARGWVRFCRPLLAFRRGFLRDVLRVRGITWREDSTNNDNSYTRNYIRNELLPTIEGRINASAVEHLAQFGEDMRPIREHEDERSRELFALCSESASVLDWRKMKRLTPDDAALVVREAGRRLGLRTLSRGRCDELSNLILKGEGFTFQWCGTTTVTGRKGRVEIHEHTGTNTAM